MYVILQVPGSHSRAHGEFAFRSCLICGPTYPAIFSFPLFPLCFSPFWLQIQKEFPFMWRPLLNVSVKDFAVCLASCFYFTLRMCCLSRLFCELDFFMTECFDLCFTSYICT